MKGSPDNRCTQCSGELFQFTSNARPVRGETLPKVCRRCGQIFVDGRVIQLPTEIQQHAAGVADMAAKKAEAAARQLIDDVQANPNVRIDRYMANLYKDGFLDGVLRALTYAQHHAKQGRLVRLLAIWDNSNVIVEANKTVVEMTPEDYHEFVDLLEMNHGARPENEHPSG